MVFMLMLLEAVEFSRCCRSSFSNCPAAPVLPVAIVPIPPAAIVPIPPAAIVHVHADGKAPVVHILPALAIAQDIFL